MNFNRLIKYIPITLGLISLAASPSYAGEFFHGPITVQDLNYELKQPQDYKMNRPAEPLPAKPPEFYQEYKKESPKQDVVYYVELRSDVGSQTKWILNKQQTGSRVALHIEPGDILKFTDTPGQFVTKLRSDKNNQGLWKKVSFKGKKSENLQVYYDWRDFETVTTHNHPLEIEILVPSNRRSVPVFTNPEDWQLTYCQHKTKPCVRDITRENPAQLLDSVIVKSKQGQYKNKYKLFYKIAFQIEDHLGDHWSDEGWIPSEYVKRNISYLPNHIIASRGPSNVFRHIEEKKKFEELKRQFVFDSNIDKKRNSPSRWLSSDIETQDTSGFFNNIAVDGILSYNNFEMEQSFLNDKFEQRGLDVGIAGHAPIFVDLELQGSATITVPFTADGGDGNDKTFLFRGDQYLMYTSPYTLFGMDLKFGLGVYYLSMLSSKSEFGFSALIGFQGNLILESNRIWINGQYGPTGQDLDFQFANREIGTEIGVRLNPDKGYRSWSIFGNYTNTTYKNPKTENSTDLQIFRIGLRKQF